MTYKEKVVLPIIGLARKYFRNTWVHRLKITSKIYKKVFSLLYKEKEVIVEFRKIKLTLPTKDTSMVPSIINQDYEKLELDIFEKILKKGFTVLDIGANLGIYTIIASRKVGKSGKIYSFEPVGENVGYLNKNIARNNVSNAKVIKKGVGNKNGKLRLYLAEKNVGTHSAGNKTDSYEEVPVVTIDSYVKKENIKPDVIKIDIEGYEGFAIEGAQKTLKACKPIVFIEFAAKHLQKCNYNPNKLLDNLGVLYKNVYMIDERANKAILVNKMSDIPHNSNQNLIFTTKKLFF